MLFFTPPPVSVSDVEAIREGHQSEVLLSIADEFPPDRCFTLVFRSRRGNLDLVAESAEEAQSWIRGIRKLVENLENMGEREKLDQYLLPQLPGLINGYSRLIDWLSTLGGDVSSSIIIRWISDWFKKADKNNDGRMNFKEVRDLLKMMNVDMSEHHAYRLFTVRPSKWRTLLGHCPEGTALKLRSVSVTQMADKSQSGTLEDDEFVLFYKMLTQREDVLKVFQEYSADGQKLSQADLEDFLREEQFEGGDIQLHAKQLIEHYEPSDTGTPTLKNKPCSFEEKYVGTITSFRPFQPSC